ncbi:MAG: methyltransferase domain-containing protein, partial [Treponema sp.]|nr:methyltransferase domain-containing protein [Treponema sp.]
MKAEGPDLTGRLLGLCPLPQNARVLDVGCGGGKTVRCLREKPGCDAWGVDIAPGPGMINARAEALPFPSASMDALVFECSLSLAADPVRALEEAARVLKSKGLVYITDLYARKPGSDSSVSSIMEAVDAASIDAADAAPPALPAESPGSSGIGRVEPWGVLAARFAGAGFRLLCFEDQSAELRSYWARLLFEGYEDAALSGIQNLRGVKAGYFLAVLEKESFTPESLAEYRRESLAGVERYARERSAFYRDHPGGFINADTLARQGERMLCVSLGDVERVRTIRSSGSTGNPKRVWFGEQDLERTVAFFASGMRPLVREGERCVIMMSDENPGSVADLLRRGLARIGVHSVIHGPIQGPGAAEAAEGAGCLVGLPAEIFWLCRAFPRLRPGTVLLSADYIPRAVMAAIEESWGCRVFTHYGLTESGYGLAVQCCVRGGHHIRLEDYLVGIIDPETGRELPPGREGEIVLSSLYKGALPLLNYRTGDIGSIEAGQCGCGSRLPRLGAVRGRR